MRRAREEGMVARGFRGASARRRAFGVVLSVLVAWFALGCQLVAGDFKIEPPDQSASGTAACTVGDYRCNGEYLLGCGSGDAGWLLKATCGSSDLCDSKNKVCEVCKPGDQRCDGVSREGCNANGTGWQEIEACASADICNPTFCGNCSPGEYSCRGDDAAAGSELWQCGKDGTWSVHLDDCGTPGLCSSTLDAARADPNFAGKCMTALCDAGTYRCDGATLDHCRQDQTAWDVVDTCSTTALCQTALKSSAATSGSLDMCPTGCSTAGAYLCNGMTLTQCRDDLTGFDTVMTCGTGTECNPVVGACTALCTPGQYQCNDKTLRHCSSTQHWEDVSDCASAALCTTAADGSSGQCLMPGCPHAGDYTCSGATLSKCADDLSGYTQVSVCASPDLCDATDKRCNDPVCMPASTYQCFDVSVNGAVQSQLRQCNAGLTAWVDVGDPCPVGQFCSNDASDPGCKTTCPSSTRCNGTELQACTADSGWVHQATCATSDLCTCTLDGSCAAGKGSDGCGVALCGGSLPIYECSGAELERCDDGRNAWNDQANCGDPTLCYPGASPAFNNGYCAVCPQAGETQCVNGTNPATVRKCSPDRTSWMTSSTCTSLGCIDSGTSDYCAMCPAGDVKCNGPTLQICPPDQKAYATRQCGAANLCDATNAQCDVCTPANSSMCSGNVLQHCSSDGQSLQSTTCPKLCDAANNRCDSCMPGSSRCMNATLYTCNSDGMTETATTCDSAAHCDATNNRCVTCLPGDFNCSGAELQKCNSAQNGWTNQTACGSTSLCSASKGICFLCSPGDYNCNGAELQQCNAAQTGWMDKSACVSAPLCNQGQGMCTPPTCQPTDFNCNGAVLQKCNTTQNGWTDQVTCSSAALCDEAQGTCLSCNPTDYNCTTMGELQKCNAMQTGFDDVMACGSPALCDASHGKCITPTCQPGDFNCSGAKLQKCNATQMGWDDVMTCTSAPLCDATDGVCTPPTCQPGDFNCNMAELQTCNTTQDGWTDKQACDSPAQCDATTGECLCAQPSYECTGNSLLTCDATGHYGSPMDCGTGTCDAAAGTCDP